MIYINSVRYNGGIEKNSYLNGLSVIEHLKNEGNIEFTSPVTFFVGENGAGKSTLIEAIAVAFGFNPEGGNRNFSFNTNATHSPLYKYLTLSKSAHARDGFFLRAESLYNAATYIEELDELPAASPAISESYGGASLHECSHGESFLAIVQNRFAGNGVYILDEPEAALAPSRQMTLLCEMKRLVENGSQFIISTHSPILMAYPDAEILEITSDGIESIDYNSCEHVKLYRTFLSSPERMTRLLFEQ